MQGAKYHDDVLTVEKGNSTDLADCCWQLKRQSQDSYKRGERRNDFEHIKYKCTLSIAITYYGCKIISYEFFCCCKI